MKVLLAYRCHDEGVDDEAAETLPPGLPWACAALRAAGHDATVANFSRLGWKDVERHLRDVSPDLFGACCLTANRKTAVRLVRLARRVRPEVVTTLGGPHALLSEALLARVKELDFVVRGEAERALVDACAALARHGRAGLVDVPGLATRARPTAEAPVPDPRSLPLPPRALQGAGILPERDLRHVVASRRRPGQEPAWSLRAPASIVEELRELRDEFGLLDVSLVGPGLVADRSFLATLSSDLVRGKAALAWDVAAALPDLLPGPRRGDESRLAEALASARRAGCRRVRLVLDAAQVQGEADDLADRLSRASATLRGAGLAAHLTVRYGVAGQRSADVARLRALVRALRPREWRLEARALLPGTPRWQELAAAEGLTDAFWFDDPRPLVPEAHPRALELARDALGLTLREVARAARPGPRDLQAAEEAGGGAWADIDWGDYRVAHSDPDEARRRYAAAAVKEPWNPFPWLRLATLAARGPRPDVRAEADALAQVLNRVPRHEASRLRAQELRLLRRGRRSDARSGRSRRA